MANQQNNQGRTDDSRQQGNREDQQGQSDRRMDSNR